MYADRRAVVVTKACERHSAALLQIADVIVLILLYIILDSRGRVCLCIEIRGVFDFT